MPLNDDDIDDVSQHDTEHHHPMRFYEFVNHDAFATEQHHVYTPSIRFLATLQRSSITVSEFVLLLLTLIFGMSLITASRLHSDDVILFQSNRTHPAWQFGIASLLGVILALSAQWTLRRYRIKGYVFTSGEWVLCVMIVLR